MGIRAPQRIGLVEYGKPESLAGHARRIGRNVEELRRHLERASRRITASLGVSDVLALSDGAIQVVDIAGAIRLAPGLDLEVRPKFLAGEAKTWREDFFCIATISMYGHILPQEVLSSTAGAKGDLSDLLGRALVYMYDQNHRRPLRAYRQRNWRRWEIDGEVDAESVVLRDEDGFDQRGMVLDRENPVNKVILEAMLMLLPDVRDGDTRRKLAQRVARLSPQRDHQRVRSTRLPSRHRRWQDLYDLCQQIHAGYGLRYGETDRGALPGFLVATAGAWESLVRTALRIGMHGREVAKIAHPFGTHVKIGQKATALSVLPDATIKNAGRCVLVGDAKYKGRFSTDPIDKSGIARSDVYEAAAFARAAGCKRAVLIYPPIDCPTATSSPGATSTFETIQLDSVEIIGLTADPRGIAESGGFGRFCKGLAGAVSVWES